VRIEPTTSTQFGAYAYWPENPFWSFQLIRLVEQACAGGSDFTEVHTVARDLPVGDVEAWHDGFRGLADELEREAGDAARGGHRVSARDAFFRASNYHRAAAFFLSPTDERHADAVLARRRCFVAAAEHHDAPIEPVEIPFGDVTLPGYRFGPPARDERGPGTLVFGGADAVAEEMYFFLGRALAERGFTVLAFDGPGQGEALRRGIHARPDWEVAATAAYEVLAAREDVDGTRIGLVGQSLGGLYATRAAAFEPRLHAVVVWGALYDLCATVKEHVDRSGATGVHYLEQYRVMLGLDDVDDVLPGLAPFTLAGVPEQMRTPTLIVHGQDDMLCPVGDAHRVMREMPGAQNKLIVYPSGEPGCTHCQVDALPLVQTNIADWLEDMARPAA
jgi:dienelactone hydrolase